MESIIKKHINFDKDLKNSSYSLLKNIKNKNILVIGGAGTIGSSYIKQVLNFKPSKLTVVDINENGLTELTRDLRSSNLLDYKPEYITYPVSLHSSNNLIAPKTLFFNKASTEILSFSDRTCL